MWSTQESPATAAPDQRHVFLAANLVIFFQADLDEGGIHRGVAGVDGGKSGYMPMFETIMSRSPGGTTLRMIFFHLCDVLIADFKPRAARHLDIDYELSGIGAREISAAKERKESNQNDATPPKMTSGGEARPERSLARTS